MFHSENKVVIKEGVTHLLGLQMHQHPDFAIAFSQVSSKFIIAVVGKKCILLIN